MNIYFNKFKGPSLHFSVSEVIEKAEVEVRGLYDPLDPGKYLYDAYYDCLEAADTNSYFLAYDDTLGYPFLKLLIKKEGKTLGELIIDAHENPWSLCRYFNESELRVINKTGLASYREIFIENSYGELNKVFPDTVIDLGMNAGFYSLLIGDRAKKYIGVEADKRMLNIALAVNKRYKNRTHIHNNAFHSSSGEDIDFYPVENLQHSSGGSLFSRAAPIKQGDFLLSPEKETADTRQGSAIKVKTITLKDIVNFHNLDHIDLLKVDVEGAEQFLLEEPNLGIILSKVDMIAVELHGGFVDMFKSNDLITKAFSQERLPSSSGGLYGQCFKFTKNSYSQGLDCLRHLRREEASL